MFYSKDVKACDANEIPPRALAGSVRIGLLATGLLMTGETKVELVVLCNEKPTRLLLRTVYENMSKCLAVCYSQAFPNSHL